MTAASPRTRPELHAVVVRVLRENFAIPDDRIHDDASLRRTLGLDSLDVVDFVFFLNTALGTQADIEEFRGIETVGQIVEALAARLAPGSSSPG